MNYFKFLKKEIKEDLKDIEPYLFVVYLVFIGITYIHFVEESIHVVIAIIPVVISVIVTPFILLWFIIMPISSIYGYKEYLKEKKIKEEEKKNKEKEFKELTEFQIKQLDIQKKRLALLIDKGYRFSYPFIGYANKYKSLGLRITHIYDEKLNGNKDVKKYYNKESYLKDRYTDIDRLRTQNTELLKWDNAKGLRCISGLKAIIIHGLKDIQIIEDLLIGLELPIDYKWVFNIKSRKDIYIIFRYDEYFFNKKEGEKIYFYPNKDYANSIKKIELVMNEHIKLPPSIDGTGCQYEFMNKNIDVPTLEPQKLSDANISKFFKQFSFEESVYNYMSKKHPLSKVEKVHVDNIKKGKITVIDENKDYTKKMISKIINSSYSKLSKTEVLQLSKYLCIYEENGFIEHWQVNKYISNNNLWNQFNELRSINSHGNYKKVKGITPKHFAIVCKVLSIKGDDGEPLIGWEKY
jgi:hypothetical protein